MHKILYFLQRTGDFSSGSYYVNFTQSGTPSPSLWNSIFIFTFASFISGTLSEIGIKSAIGFRYLWRVDIGTSCLFYRQWNVFCVCTRSSKLYEWIPHASKSIIHSWTSYPKISANIFFNSLSSVPPVSGLPLSTTKITFSIFFVLSIILYMVRCLFRHIQILLYPYFHQHQHEYLPCVLHL